MLEIKSDEILKKLDDLKKRINELENLIKSEEVIELKKIPKDEAKKLILDYIEKHEGCWTDEIIFDLKLDPVLVVEVLKELEGEEEVESR